MPAADVSCLDEINKARELVDLSPFGKRSEELTKTTGLTPDAICKKLIHFAGISSDKHSGEKGTIAFAFQKEQSCPAAVQKWKRGYWALNGKPTTFKAGEGEFKDPDAVHFMALYNPIQGGQVACAFYKCKDDQEQTDLVDAMVCAMDGKVEANFTEEQWEKIVKAMEGSATYVSPGIVLLGAAALGYVLY
ncbi:SAG family member [Cyclospora cayetanensis]|uniref:SAG family member n=1 Tax=Cyclospora cayetanensis TaxID=88456 RepID=A0A1D3DAE5_9EIME|nr:SAG family member [Cyclospora cayetanensis]